MLVSARSKDYLECGGKAQRDTALIVRSSAFKWTHDRDQIRLKAELRTKALSPLCFAGAIHKTL